MKIKKRSGAVLAGLKGSVIGQVKPDINKGVSHYTSGWRLTYMQTGGFTLIELLVVVLIIGILASIALPQYQKAVVKSRYATLKNLTHTIVQAQEVFYLTNGRYSMDFEELGIDMPAGKLNTSTATNYTYDWGSCVLVDPYQAQCTHNQGKMQYQVRYPHAGTLAYPGNRVCIAFSLDIKSVQNTICKQETKATQWINGGNYYAWIYVD